MNNVESERPAADGVTSAPLRSRAEKAKEKKQLKLLERRKAEYRRRRIAARSQIYHNFTVSKARRAPIEKAEHEAVFTENGLSRFEVWYNTASILLHQKSERTKHGIKPGYEHIFAHPHGWTKDKKTPEKMNIHDLKIKLLELIPGVIGRGRKLTSPIRRALSFFASSESSSFAIGSLKMNAESIFSVAVPVILGGFVAFYISDTMSYDVQIMAHLGGEPIGIVESPAVMEEYIENFEETTESMLGGKYHLENEVTYSLVSTKQKRCLSGSEVHGKLGAYMKERFTLAWALYLDGSYVAAAEDENELKTIVRSVDKSDSGRFQIIRKLCSNETIRSCEDIYWTLIGGDSSIEGAAEADLALLLDSGEAAPEYTYNNDEGTENDSKIYAFVSPAAYSEKKLPLNLSVEYGILRTEGSNFLRAESLATLSANYVTASGQLVTGAAASGVQRTVATETVDEEIPYDTLYEDTSSYYVGTEKISNEGTPGIRRVTYNIEYINGEEYSRIATASEVVSLPVDRVILRGTLRKPSTEPSGTFIWPASGYLSSGYGSREIWTGYDFHLGIDIVGYTGKPIYSADGGTVIFAGKHPSYGNLTIIQHAPDTKTYYAHQSQMLVSVGDKVYQGQHIGKMGSTGNSSGPHLHFEIRKNGSTVNPMKYLP